MGVQLQHCIAGRTLQCSEEVQPLAPGLRLPGLVAMLQACCHCCCQLRCCCYTSRPPPFVTADRCCCCRSCAHAARTASRCCMRWLRLQMARRKRDRRSELGASWQAAPPRRRRLGRSPRCRRIRRQSGGRCWPGWRQTTALTPLTPSDSRVGRQGGARSRLSRWPAALTRLLLMAGRVLQRQRALALRRRLPLKR